MGHFMRAIYGVGEMDAAESSFVREEPVSARFNVLRLDFVL